VNFFLLLFSFFSLKLQDSFFHIPEDKKAFSISTLVKKAPSVLRQKGGGGGRRGWLASLFAVNRPEEEEAIIREQDLV
jgi:hypothetical protein